jgi:hypothetical protein
MIPHIQYKDKTIVSVLIYLATAGHIPVAYVMVMIQDLINHAEKNKILNAAADNYYLF